MSKADVAADLAATVNVTKVVESITEYFKLKESEKTRKIELQEKFETIRIGIEAMKELAIKAIDSHYQHLDKIYSDIATSQEKLMNFYSKADTQEEKQMLMDMIKVCSNQRSELIQKENLNEIKFPKNISLKNIEET